MAMSKRAQRMERHHTRRKTIPLNLVSLMDIFTILVFFLLVNSTEVEVLPNNKSVKLPEAAATVRPRETVVVMITGDRILLQGQVVATLDEVRQSKANTITALKVALESQTQRRVTNGGVDENAQSEVTILGDRDTSYSILRKIMATCTSASYGRISLAVLQKNDAQPG